MIFLITGGAGFIGSNFLNLMVNKYPRDTYICFDKLTYAGNLSNLDNIKDKDNFIFIKGDITSFEDVSKVFNKYKIDYVINFAAESHVDRSILNPDIFLNTNVKGVNILLNESLKHNIKKFHQVSTDEVYGDTSINDTYKFNESSLLRPSSPYSASKASADLLCMSYFRTYSLPVTISRCGNNFGPYQHKEKLIPLVINNCLNNKETPLYGDGKNIREWIYVDDHNLAIDLIVRSDKVGEIYNIGSNNDISNIEIVKLILKELNKDESLIKYVLDRKGHDKRYSLDYSKIKNELNYNPTTSFEDGIKKTIKWYKENEDWIKNLKE